MPESQSPLARLVLFIFCLSVAGSLVAGVHYFTVDLPRQQNVQVPTNGICPPSIVSSASSCANYGSMCYTCLAMRESGSGCEISGSDKISICESGQHQEPDCTYAAENGGLCLVK